MSSEELKICEVCHERKVYPLVDVDIGVGTQYHWGDELICEECFQLGKSPEKTEQEKQQDIECQERLLLIASRSQLQL